MREGTCVNLDAITHADAESEIPGGALLLAFAQALVEGEDAALAGARAKLEAAMGSEAVVDAAGVASNFERMVRIADATGIPQEAPVMMLGDDLIEELDLRRFGSAANTPPTTGPRSWATIQVP